MTPKKFYEGQSVTPVQRLFYKATDPWDRALKQSPVVFGNVYHVDRYIRYDEEWIITIVGVDSQNTFCESCFAPVISDDQLEEALKDVIHEKVQA